MQMHCASICASGSSQPWPIAIPRSVNQLPHLALRWFGLLRARSISPPLPRTDATHSSERARNLRRAAREGREIVHRRQVRERSRCERLDLQPYLDQYRPRAVPFSSTRSIPEFPKRNRGQRARLDSGPTTRTHRGAQRHEVPGLDRCAWPCRPLRAAGQAYELPGHELRAQFNRLHGGRTFFEKSESKSERCNGVCVTTSKCE
jgi:hypothetical protein